jgi:mRNA interferase MazF
MGAPTRGSVAMVPFPFSDLSQAKLRPAVVLANAGRGDWILCQVTSNPYGDSLAILIQDGDFQLGSLRVASFARPGKLFTAHETLLHGEAGKLKPDAFERVPAGVLRVLG